MFLTHFVVRVIQFVNLFFRPLILKDKVVIISRQADEPTLDIRLLTDFLKSKSVNTIVLTSTLKKTVTGMIKYAIHMMCQMYHISTSKIVILDGYCILVSILPKKGEQKVIQMWHALGAIKKFGWQNAENPDGNGKDIAEVMCMHRNYDYIFAPSEITGKFFAEAFRTSEDKIVRYGLPRIDYLKAHEGALIDSMAVHYPSVRSKINVLYVPTFRKNSELDLKKLVTGFDFTKMNLIVKKHFLDKGDYSWAEKTGAIIDSKFSSMDWLKICTKVITDYSAIAFEAAVLDRDIYIYQPDITDYQYKVGLNIDLYQEDIGRYVCDSEIKLFERLEEAYDMKAVEAFRKKYLNIDLEHCTKDIGDFVIKLLAK